MSEFVRIVEVSARDGLQNEKVEWSVPQRVELIRKIIQAGFQSCEAGSFVSPKAIPMMKDSDLVFKSLTDDLGKLSFLVPNQKGLETAIETGVKEIAVFTATSDSFTSKNINRSVEESLIELRAVSHAAINAGLRVRGYVSTAFGCPYEGKQEVSKLLEVTDELFKMGCYEVSVGDTIGVAHPAQARDVFKQLRQNFQISQIAAHMHDTRGFALVNLMEALNEGIRVFDASLGGLGGCPYAPGASGNVATEEVNHLLLSLGFETGLDTLELLNIVDWLESQLNRSLPSKLHLSAPKKLYYDR